MTIDSKNNITQELNLQKEQTSYSDLLDALRLSLIGY